MVATQEQAAVNTICHCCHEGRPCPCCPMHYDISEEEKKKLANAFAYSQCGFSDECEEYEAGGDWVPKCDRCAWISVGWQSATWPGDA